MRGSMELISDPKTYVSRTPPPKGIAITNTRLVGPEFADLGRVCQRRGLECVFQDFGVRPVILVCQVWDVRGRGFTTVGFGTLSPCEHLTSRSAREILILFMTIVR
jgi:hypothetical protein